MTDVMLPGYYVIFTGLGGRTCLGLSQSNLVLQTFTSSSNATTWIVHPAAGSRAYYLEHQATSLCARFGQSPIGVSPLDPNYDEAVHVNKDRADGYVSIANHDESLVYAVYGADNQPGTQIVPDKWGDGENHKKWRFVPTGALSRTT
jgi:hypothetical protein